MSGPRLGGLTTRRSMLLLVTILGALLVVLLVLLVLELRTEASLPRPDATAGIRPVHEILGPGIGDSPFFRKPMGAAYGKDGRIYVADTGNNRVVVFDSDAKYLFQFGGLGVGKPAPGVPPTWEPGRFNYPTDVAADEDGNIYVADFRNDQIQVFDPDGNFLRAFPDRNKPVGKGASGSNGTGIGVTSIAVDKGRVYATDRYQVVVFDTNGKLLGQFGRPGSGPADLDHPNGVAVGPEALLAVSDSNNNRVLGFTPAGKHVWSAGELDVEAFTEPGGHFEVPRGLAYMEDGTIIVADALASSIVLLDATGAFDASFGQRGDAAGELNFPTDVDSRGQDILVAEKGNDRVQVVRLER